jgi:hypothetical protein
VAKKIFPKNVFLIKSSPYPRTRTSSKDTPSSKGIPSQKDTPSKKDTPFPIPNTPYPPVN